ncbi:MAG: CoA-binding protein, partial [Gammaproteobacteria bacterium]|nr:CoA-binding protein [Gammaproteobacteria bacterium]
MEKAEALKRLLRPASVAFIGGDSAAEAIRQCQAIGFDGEMWAVNQTRASLAGIPCVASLDALPAVPDASFIAAPPEASLALIAQLAATGAPGAVCFAAGFAETGATGAELQTRLCKAAGDMAVIGPNCHGFVNYLDGVALWPDQHGGRRVQRGAALVTQSGNIAINLTMQQRGLDIAYVLSGGNNSVLGLHDYIDALLSDQRVNAIGLHIEGIDDIAAFSTAAIRALKRRVPIVALKSGRSLQGAEIARSHTASLAGSDQLYDALFRRLGIARCNTLSEFLETLKLVTIAGLPQRDSIGSMSCSGGDAALVADVADRLGLPTPLLKEASKSRLQDLLGPNVHISNPLDYHLYVWADYDALRACFSEMLQQGFGCTLLVLDYPHSDASNIDNWLVAERALTDAMAETGEMAVIVASLPETMPEIVRDRLKSIGIAPMQGIDDCLFAIRAAASIANAQGQSEATPVLASKSREPASAAWLNEWQSKRILDEMGVDVPGGRLCKADSV